jgi:chitinase
MGSAVSFVNAWKAAGMPPDQIVLGVASYGHSFRVTNANAYKGTSGSLALYPPFVAKDQPAGDAWDGPPGNDVCGNFQGPSGDVDFWGLISLGYLNPNGTPKKGIDFMYDKCAKTVNFSFLTSCLR